MISLTLVYPAVLVRFSKYEVIHRDLVQLSDAVVVGTEGQEPVGLRAKDVWSMLYADGTGIALMLAEGLTKMMTVIVTGFEAAGITTSDKRRRRQPSPRRSRHRSSRPEYKQTVQIFLYPGPIMH